MSAAQPLSNELSPSTRRAEGGRVSQRNLILIGGLYHDFEPSAQTLAGILGEVGVHSDVTSDIDAGLADLDAYDLLTVYALRWTMPQEKFAAQRERWAFSLGDTQRAAIERHLAAGRGLLVLHTGAICFDDWPRWRELVGAGWTWGHSFHPPHGLVNVRPSDVPHPITEGLEAFDFDDEAYTQMDLAPGLQPLAQVKAAAQDSWSPCLWARDVGPARMVFDALGHDSASFNHPTHRQIVQRAALWTLKQPLTTSRP